MSTRIAMRFLSMIVTGLLVAGGFDGAALAQTVPAAVFTDPPADAGHPAKSTVLHIPSHGVLINGLMYSPPGSGPHPTLVICHGLPGNEKNLDLAQAVRRAGWNAVTFNYRGSWGSPGEYRFTNTIEDAASVLAYLRIPANAAQLGVDTRRMVLAGHSLGGWVTVHTAAHDHGLIGAILISAADLREVGEMPLAKLIPFMADNKESLAGVTARSMALDLKRNSKQLGFVAAANGLNELPLLVMTSDDGLAADSDKLVQAIKKGGGGTHITEIHKPTDHSWSDQRISLESAVISWLAGLSSP